MTALADIIRQEIAANGPMRLDRYMALCLGHPAYGYYMTRDPFGAAGDFTTAPEISQMFGEFLGIWCASVWQAMGSPERFFLVELGPGRGTLMADMLRATVKVPGFADAAEVVLVETSPVLRAVQAQKLGERAQWLDDLGKLPDGPLVVVANEFFDAIPIRQLQWQGGRWFERHIGLDSASQLAFGLVPTVFERPGTENAILEFSPQRAALAAMLGRKLGSFPGAALLIDYGHAESSFGDTLQAVGQHRFVSPLDAPGEVDLTAHVDFAALATGLREGGAVTEAVLTQRDFLLAMGLELRARILSAREPVQTAAAVERLAGNDQMGRLFKVLAARSSDLPMPYPFGSP